MRKKSKSRTRKLQDKLWELCKKIIRAKYPPICYTCDRPISGSNDHTSHLIPKGACGAFLKYDLRNLRRCCYNCNINLGGNSAEFYRRMVQREGQAYADKLFQDKQIIVKADIIFYEAKISEYQNILEKMRTYPQITS